MEPLGAPRIHFRRTDSTNTRARELAAGGAPHGTLVTADEQSAGRGRQGRTWSAPPGAALLGSILLREPPRLLPLAAGVAVAEACEETAAAGARAMLKWPNDVLIDGRKVAGILVEGRPQERWAVLGIGINVAVAPEAFPPELRDRAGTLARPPSEIEPTLARVIDRLEFWLAAGEETVLAGVRARDALIGHPIAWATGEGTAAGIDADGRLVVESVQGQLALDAGEVHLTKR